MPKVDMSKEAVTARLKQTSRLRELCLRLALVRPIDPCTKPVKSQTAPGKSLDEKP